MLRYDAEFHKRKNNSEPNRENSGVFSPLNLCEEVSEAYDIHKRIGDEPREYTGPSYFFSEEDLREIGSPQELIEIVKSALATSIMYPNRIHGQYLKETPNQANLAFVICKDLGIPHIGDNIRTDIAILIKVKDRWKVSTLDTIANYAEG